MLWFLPAHRVVQLYVSACDAGLSRNVPAVLGTIFVGGGGSITVTWLSHRAIRKAWRGSPLDKAGVIAGVLLAMALLTWAYWAWMITIGTDDVRMFIGACRGTHPHWWPTWIPMVLPNWPPAG